MSQVKPTKAEIEEAFADALKEMLAMPFDTLLGEIRSHVDGDFAEALALTNTFSSSNSFETGNEIIRFKSTVGKIEKGSPMVIQIAMGASSMHATATDTFYDEPSADDLNFYAIAA
jgi:hypothetical protein